MLVTGFIINTILLLKYYFEIWPLQHCGQHLVHVYCILTISGRTQTPLWKHLTVDMFINTFKYHVFALMGRFQLLLDGRTVENKGKLILSGFVCL